MSVYEVAGEAHVPAAEISGEAAAARQRAAKGKAKVGEEPACCPSLAHASGDSAWSLEQQQPWTADGQQQHAQQQQQTTQQRGTVEQRLGRLAAAVLAAGTPTLEEALTAVSTPAAAPGLGPVHSNAGSPGSSGRGTAVELTAMPGGSRPGSGSSSDGTCAWAAEAGPSRSGSWEAQAGPSGSGSGAWASTAPSGSGGSRYSDRV